LIAFGLELTVEKYVAQTGTAGRHARRGASSTISVARDAIGRFRSDRCTMMSASIGFYSALSVAPTLLIVLAVAGWVFGNDLARGQLFAQIHDIMGNEAAGAMQAIVGHAHLAGGGGFAGVMSALLLVVGASATFSSLSTALDVVFAAQPKKGVAGLALLVRARLVSFELVWGICFLLVVLLVLNAAVNSAGQVMFGHSKLLIVAAIVQTVFRLVVLCAAFTALLRWLPNVPVQFRHAGAGAAVSAVLFTLGHSLFGLYLVHAGTVNLFRAAGSLAVLMIWLYFSAAVFLLGAEVAAALKRSQESTVAAEPDESQVMKRSPAPQIFQDLH
jgi:membrane protein